MKYEIGTADSFRARFTVKQNGVVKSLVGATAVAFATNGTTTITGTTDLSDAVNGRVGVIFPAGSFAVGDWEVQARVTLGGETQTVGRAYFRAYQSLLAA
jgi:hypothetical protein